MSAAESGIASCGSAPTACFELVFAPAHQTKRPAPWQGAPGCVVAFEPGGLALHFAPARWLLIDVGARVADAAVDAGAVLIDVQGKWRLFKFATAQGNQLLCTAIDLSAILSQRECAAATVFDVPSVIAHLGDSSAYLVCVPASYAMSFAASLRHAARES